MARVLAISSQVVRGHVGLSAIVPGLQRLGHEVLGLPTVLLSNHPGHAHVAGDRIAPSLLARLLAALEANGWLDDVAAVLTGYLPSPDHVALAAEAVVRVRRRRPDAHYVCDPVIGDDPKGVYVDPAAAACIRETLLPLASLITPNRFELSHLAGAPVNSVREACAAACGLAVPTLATSIAAPASDMLANVLVQDTRSSMQPVMTLVPRRDRVAHGTGDLMSALVTGEWLSRGDLAASLAAATAAVDAVVAASAGDDELNLSAPDQAWRLRRVPPLLSVT